MPAINPRDVTFLELRDSMLCSECELISYNNTAQCLACGSRAVLSLARVLGGSLLGEQRVRMVAEEPLKSVIEMPKCPAPPVVRAPVVAAASVPSAEAGGATPIHSAMKMVVERAYRISRSGGAAVAAGHKGRMFCQARMGAVAPSLGSEVRTGISAMSVSTARTLRCDVADDDPRVNAAACRASGVQSIVAAPIAGMDSVLGLVTVLSPQRYAFDDRDVAVVQWLAGIMGVVFTNSTGDLALTRQSATRGELTAKPNFPL